MFLCPSRKQAYLRRTEAQYALFSRKDFSRLQLDEPALLLFEQSFIYCSIDGKIIRVYKRNGKLIKEINYPHANYYFHLSELKKPDWLLIFTENQLTVFSSRNFQPLKMYRDNEAVTICRQLDSHHIIARSICRSRKFSALSQRNLRNSENLIISISKEDAAEFQLHDLQICKENRNQMCLATRDGVKFVSMSCQEIGVYFSGFKALEIHQARKYEYYFKLQPLSNSNPDPEDFFLGKLDRRVNANPSFKTFYLPTSFQKLLFQRTLNSYIIIDVTTELCLSALKGDEFILEQRLVVPWAQNFAYKPRFTVGKVVYNRMKGLLKITLFDNQEIAEKKMRLTKIHRETQINYSKNAMSNKKLEHEFKYRYSNGADLILKQKQS